jgi:hypothetical protein
MDATGQPHLLPGVINPSGEPLAAPLMGTAGRCAYACDPIPRTARRRRPACYLQCPDHPGKTPAPAGHRAQARHGSVGAQ